jgi:hypothetical protein
MTQKFSDIAGKGGGGMVRPPRAAESKWQQVGQQKEYFKRKI